MTALDQELAHFQQILPGLLASDRDRFALVAGGQLLGTWPTEEEALAAGYARCGVGPFLVRRIVEHEKPVYFSRNLKGEP